MNLPKVVRTVSDNEENDENKPVDASDIEDKISVKHEEGKKAKSEKKHPLGFVDDFFPDKENMKQKGNLKRALTVLLSSAPQIFEFYPEIKQFKEPVMDWCDDIEERQVSIDGLSREQMVEVLKSVMNMMDMKEENTGENSFFEEIFSAGRPPKGEE